MKIQKNDGSTENIVFKFVPGSSYSYEINTFNINESKYKPICIDGKYLDNLQKHENETNTNLTFNFNCDKNAAKDCSIQIKSHVCSGKSILNSLEESLPTPYSTASQIALNGVFFDLNLDETGKVKKISGYDTFQKRFDLAYENELKRTGSHIDEDIKKSEGSLAIREPYFIDLFEQISASLPVSGIFERFEWQTKETIDIGGMPSVLVHHSCNKILHNIAFIKSLASVDVPISGANHTMRMVGTLEGKREIDAHSGMLIKSQKKLVLHGETQIGKLTMYLYCNRKIIINMTNGGKQSPP